MQRGSPVSLKAGSQWSGITPLTLAPLLLPTIPFSTTRPSPLLDARGLPGDRWLVGTLLLTPAEPPVITETAMSDTHRHWTVLWLFHRNKRGKHVFCFLSQLHAGKSMSGKKTRGQHLGPALSSLWGGGVSVWPCILHYQKNALFVCLLPSRPCRCPPGVSSSLDLRDVGHNMGRPESRCTRQVLPNPSTSIVSLQEMTQQRSGCWMALLKRHPAWILNPLLQSRPPAGLPAGLEHLRFSPPTLPTSPLSAVPFWLPACTFSNTQPPYLPPSPAYVVALLPYLNQLISYWPSVQLVCSWFLLPSLLQLSNTALMI